MALKTYQLPKITEDFALSNRGSIFAGNRKFSSDLIGIVIHLREIMDDPIDPRARRTTGNEIAQDAGLSNVGKVNIDSYLNRRLADRGYISHDGNPLEVRRYYLTELGRETAEFFITLKAILRIGEAQHPPRTEHDELSEAAGAIA